MFLIFVLTTLVACSAGAVLQDERIVGGENITVGRAPYQVALLFDYYGLAEYTLSCGGTILSRTLVLTAAHCTHGTRASQWRVRAGSNVHNTGGQVVSLNKITQHAEFNPQFENDIALLFLLTQLSFGSSVAAVSLPLQGQAIEDKTLVNVTGWGAISEGGATSVQLKRVTVAVVNQEKCANYYATINPVSSNMICAGQTETGGKDVCDGDSGGPLVYNDVLFGIGSWGNGCGRADFPGVYTRIPNYRNWIYENMLFL